MLIYPQACISEGARDGKMCESYYWVSLSGTCLGSLVAGLHAKLSS
jgi:hypothetical protein